jgi:sec-independent protein translocase protein TatC
MDKRQTIVAHLEELRRRLIICIISFLALTCILLFVPSVDGSLITKLSKHLQAHFIPVIQPGLLQFGIKLVFLDPLEPIFVLMKLSALISLAVLLPLFFYQVIAFVSPALTPRRRGVLIWFSAGSIVFFAIGALLSYFFLIPATFRILIGYGLSTGAVPQLSIGKFFDLLLWMFIMFSLPFELPLVIGFLNMAGILSTEKLKKIRKPAYLGIAIFSAAVTPDPTPFSMLILSAGLVLFYELGIIISALFREKG